MNATNLTFIPHMNKGTRVLDNGLVAEYSFLPGAYDKLEFNFKVLFLSISLVSESLSVLLSSIDFCIFNFN